MSYNKFFSSIMKTAKSHTRITRRYLHDSKLPSVSLYTTKDLNLIGTQSPRKADFQLTPTSKKSKKSLDKLTKKWSEAKISSKSEYDDELNNNNDRED